MDAWTLWGVGTVVTALVLAEAAAVSYLLSIRPERPVPQTIDWGA